MEILVLNSGSSSLKAAVVNAQTGVRALSLVVERIGEPEATMRRGREAPEACEAPNHDAALSLVLDALVALDVDLVAAGHRVVHGGAEFDTATLIDDPVQERIEALCALAPLHNPANLSGIRAARALLPDIPHVAVFDTAFHATLPRRARAYALPRALAEARGVRRFGFHGTSHACVARRAAEFLGRPLRELRVVTCHLGNGCSVAAVEYGRSVETSMGMTPLEGLVMGTRAGDIDVGAVLCLMRTEGLDVDAVDRLLNRESGLLGLSGVGKDMRDIERSAASGNDDARMALHVFCHRVRKYIGAYAAVMGGVDAIVFTAGIGEKSATVRHRVAQRFDFLGALFDEDANREVALDDETPVAAFSAPHSPVALLAVQTDEEGEIARAAAAVAEELGRVPATLTIPVAVSGRHLHVDEATLAALFGAGHALRVAKPLSQPGQFAAEERVTLVGPRGTIEGVRILGPCRPHNQIEISTTDEFTLGLDAPVRASGHVENSPGITLVGPAGSLTLERGVICAWRHVHMHPDDAERFGVSDKQVVDVAIDSAGRDLVFGDVLIRVKESYRLEMHIDTDEANAAGVVGAAEGTLVALTGSARILRSKRR